MRSREATQRDQRNAVRRVMDLKLGEPVWYYPVWGDVHTRHAMVVDGEHRSLGAELVIALEPDPSVPVEARYRRISAAALWAVTRRVPMAPTANP